MTPATDVRTAVAKAAKRAGPRTAPGHSRKPSGSPGGRVPRRISGPVAPRALPRTSPRPAPAGQAAPLVRLAAFLFSAPDHPLLDRIIRGRVWIPLLGVLLAGIVGMQVELLKLNAAAGRSIELISALQSRNEGLRAQVVSATDPGRIERLASHMGMTMPGPEAITFLSVWSASLRRAVASIHVPDLAAFEAELQASSAGTAAPTSTTTTPATPAGSTSGTTSSTGLVTTTARAAPSTVP